MSASRATPRPEGRSERRIHFDFEERVLDNGLRVLLHRDRSAPVVAVHLMYHVGSKDERPGRTGFAHLFEHLLFQGSEHVPREQHFKLIQSVGGTLNGTTWFDRTNYFETVPSNQLETALWLESDRMGFFLPAITQEKLDNQREVVKNERRQSYENRPYGLAFETLLGVAFPEGHPYRHPTIGYMEDIEAATLADVREFFSAWYGPNNAVLVVAGDIEPAAALPVVEKWFGEIPARPTPSRGPPPPAVPPGERRATIEDRVQVPRVYLMYHAPSFLHPDFEVVDVLSSLLADGKSSRLHRELVYRRRVAAEVQAFTWPIELTGMLFVIATARPGVPAAALEEAVRGQLRSLVEEGVEDREVEGARNRARRALLGMLNSVGERADVFAHAATLRGDPAYVNRMFERYERVDAGATDRVAGEVLGSDSGSVVTVLPRAGEPGTAS